MRPLFILASIIVTISFVRAENVLQDGNFASGTAGSPPLEPWSLSKPKPNISLQVDTPPGEKGRWVRIVDESAQDAAVLAQKFPEITAGRLTFKLHIVQSGAAIWFLFGQKEQGGREDAVFGFKIDSRGQLLVARGSQKVGDASGTKASFPGGETYDLYCEFKPAGEGMEIEIGQVDGKVLFRGAGPMSGTVSALSIRTHGEEMGSDFFLTDLVLAPAS
jgi:hypothetical protein